MFSKMLPTVIVACLVFSSAALRGQEPAKADDSVKKLLDKIDQDAKEKPKGDPADKKAAASELAPKDQELDSLLGKFSETPDEPTAKGKANPGANPTAKPEVGGKGGDAALKPDEKSLDEELEKILGRKKKKKDQDQENDQANPLSKTIKKMREVEKRLEKPDTGSETRQKQEQIVKDLEQLIDQIRQGKADGSGRKVIRRVQQAGLKPGNQPGQNSNQGNTGGNAPFTKPSDPRKNNAIARSKDVWGDLQAELRAEVENVANEKPLPAKEMLIRRYYLSIAKKSLSRGSSE